jgi:mRNA-degrading endonuclease RelE of RelBE toxin-antitoxin system
MPVIVSSIPSFDRVSKKLHAKDKKILDDAVREIATNPLVGEEKKGDLAGVFVHKFNINNSVILLAYELHPNKFSPEIVVLLAVGPHENFYEQLKRTI